MPLSFIIPAAASIGGALIGANAAQDAANTQAQGQQASLALQKQMFDQQQANQKPYLQAGYSALSDIQNLMPTLNRPFTAADLNSYLAPNYQFMLGQGQQATQMGTNAASPGSNVDRANQIFTQNYAGNAYQNAFNNYQLQNQNIYNRLASLAGIGQTSAGQQTQATTNAMGTMGNTLGNISTAQAAGQIGSANALAGGLSNAGNYGLLSSLLQPQAASGGGGGGGYFSGIGAPQPAASSNIYSLV